MYLSLKHIEPGRTKWVVCSVCTEAAPRWAPSVAPTRRRPGVLVRADVQLQITVSFEDRLLAQLYALDLARCPPWVPNLAFSKIYVTLNSGDPQHTTLLLDGGERGDFYIRSPESM